MKKIIEFKTLGDERGCLISLEQGYNIPFDIKRVYYIFGTQKDVIRGYHAHKKLKQLAICVKGTCDFVLDNGVRREVVHLNSPDYGLLIEDLTWREMMNFSDDCVLLVLASANYDESDYIRDYNDFLLTVNNNEQK